jgi:hypothetical protein
LEDIIAFAPLLTSKGQPTIWQLAILQEAQLGSLHAHLQEASLLEDVAVQFSSTYDFTSSGSQGASQFGELFEALVRLAQWSGRSCLRQCHVTDRQLTGIHQDTHIDAHRLLAGCSQWRGAQHSSPTT